MGRQLLKNLGFLSKLMKIFCSPGDDSQLLTILETTESYTANSWISRRVNCISLKLLQEEAREGGR